MSRFGERVTATFDFVSLRDPAIIETFDEETIRAYELTRDLSKLDLSRCGTPPLIAVCAPLGTYDEKWDNLAGTVQSPIPGNLTAPAAAWEVFANHTGAFKNGLASVAIKWEGGKPYIPNSERKKISLEYYIEAAFVIVERASRGGDLPLPHTRQGIWRPETTLLMSLRQAVGSLEK